MELAKKLWYSRSAEACKACLKRCLMRLCRQRYGVQRKVVFRSFSGNHYSDNPKAISQRLHELDPNIEIVWMFNRPDEMGVPAYVRKASNRTRTIIWEYSTAMGWVDNFGLNRNYAKSSSQRYVQTWHGDRSFKRVICQSEKLDFTPDDVVEDKICDLCLAGSDFGLETYRTAFLYNGSVICTGTPRCDALVTPNDELRLMLRKRIGLDDGARYVLYAPTFRDKGGLESDASYSELNVSELIAALESSTGEQWHCLVRVHPSIAEKTLQLDERAINVSSWEDMTDLLIVADALISDYSSSVGDFALTGRPIVLFQYDLERYESESRELRFDMAASPYVVATDNESVTRELVRLVNNPDEAKRNDDAILSFYGTYETGHATEDACRFLLTGELNASSVSHGMPEKDYAWLLSHLDKKA